MTLTKSNLLFVTLFILVVAMFSIVALAQTNPDAKPPESKVETISGLNAKFIVALISDGNDGAWIGTEDEGVFHWQADGKITQFTTKNGLGDNNGYALAIDARGRLWVGHLNSGVSVFNGKDWRNYDVVDGPIGERIFDIEICPKDGDVWMATSAGISRYKIDDDEWEHFTREDGLLEDQVSALVFLDDGTLIVGTQCHGLAIFNRTVKGEYKHSKNILAPDRFGIANCSPVPLELRGSGLPSNLINDIIVAQNAPDQQSQGIWIATSTGLVKANNDFSKIEFWRGRDYADKVRGLWGGAPKDFKPAPKEIMDQLLPEDYLTCLAEDAQGVIWIGTRQNGFVIADQKTGQRATGTQKGLGLPDNFVTKLLLLNDGHYLIGFYGGGVVKSKNPFELVTRKPIKKPTSKIRSIHSVAQNDFKNLPSPIKPPTVDELKKMQAKLDKLRKPLPKIYAAYYGEDWKTQGDWVGHYGRLEANMCGAAAPFDHYYFRAFFPMRTVHSFIGPNRTKDDTIRRWVHWLQTDNPKVMYSPIDGYRRQAEWDDHGETYPISKDGPDIWYHLGDLPEGVFNISMYFFNKDGQDGNNRLRDFVIEVYSTPHKWDEKIKPKFSTHGEELVRKSKPLCRARVRDFWGGVHKSFAVQGLNNYMIKIDRNYSFCTIVSSVTIDRFAGQPKGSEAILLPSPIDIEYNPLPIPEEFISPVSEEAAKLWIQSGTVQDKINGQIVTKPMQQAILVAAISAAPKDAPIEHYDVALSVSLLRRLRQWNPEMRKEFNEAMIEARKVFTKKYPRIVKRQEEQLKKRKDGTWKYPLEGVTSE